jgi:hypothetical protein
MATTDRAVSLDRAQLIAQATVKQGMFKGWLHKKERTKMQP